jgi:hypothetical protein
MTSFNCTADPLLAHPPSLKAIATKNDGRPALL